MSGIVLVRTKLHTDKLVIGFKLLDKSDRIYEFSADSCPDVEEIKYIMANFTTVGFDSHRIDIPLIRLLCKHPKSSFKKLYTVMSEFTRPGGMLMSTRSELVKDFDLYKPSNWDHIDIKNVAGSRDRSTVESLNIYAARMNVDSIDIDNKIESELSLLCSLYNKLHEEMKLRYLISGELSHDVRSYSDSKISETYFRDPSASKKHDSKDHIYYKAPKSIKFKDSSLSSLVKQIESTIFRTNEYGKIESSNSTVLKQTIVNIHDNDYRIGLGGIHSTQKSMPVVPEEGEFLYEIDVKSYYPSIIINDPILSEYLGDKFLLMYKDLYERRLIEEKSGNKIKSDAYKLILNSVFGKFNCKYSNLYSPESMLRVTITGQLMILMLIETFGDHDLKVVSANTDSILVKGRLDQESLLRQLCASWCEDTNLSLKYDEYSKVFFENINSYVAIKKDKTVKLKGSFANGSIYKNSTTDVCKKAVVNFLLDGKDIIDSVLDHTNTMSDFTSYQKVSAGYGKSTNDVARWYYSKDGESVKDCNGRSLPNGSDSKSALNMKDICASDLDYKRYVHQSYKMLTKIGVVV